jgi:hypothetical protein
VAGNVGYLQYDHAKGEASYGAQNVREFSGKRDEELFTVSTLALMVEGDADMPAPNISVKDLLKLPEEQFKKHLRDLSLPDMSAADLLNLPGEGNTSKTVPKLEGRGITG